MSNTLRYKLPLKELYQQRLVFVGEMLQLRWFITDPLARGSPRQQAHQLRAARQLQAPTVRTCAA